MLVLPMTQGRPKKPLVLNDEDRGILEALARRRKSAHAESMRARIVLRCAEGLSNTEVAAGLGLSKQTVGKWRARFIDGGVGALGDAPRGGAPRGISDSKVEEVVAKTLEASPENATHWSTRKMAAACGISHDSVARIWKAFGLQPHRAETFRLSTDPFFIEKVRDVVGLYMSPPENALVLCVDEKSQMQALERSQPVLPIGPGRPERRSHDYYRHGTTSLFAAFDIASGVVIGECRKRHTSRDFLAFLKTVEEACPEDCEIHAVLDNYATHKTPPVKRWLARHPRWHLHFIPTHSSWLNQVERWFAKITDEVIRRGVFRSVAELEEAVENYIHANNENPKPFKWTADADLILGKVTHLCKELL